MAAMSPERARVRSRIANLSKENPGHPELVELRREYKALKILDSIRDELGDGTVLSGDQRARIIAALGGSAAR